MLFHLRATCPHENDPLSPQLQHMLWLYTVRRALVSGDPSHSPVLVLVRQDCFVIVRCLR